MIHAYILFQYYNGEKYSSLKEYLESGGWDIYQESAGLISIKEVLNNNGLKFIETIAKVSGGRQSSGYYKDKAYYTNYNKKVVNKYEKAYRQIKNAQDFISIDGPLLNSSDSYKKGKKLLTHLN